MKYIRSEFAKNKRRKFWRGIAAMFLFTLLWGGLSTTMQLKNYPTQVVPTIIFNMLTVDNLVFPFMVALFCVRLVQLEFDQRMVQVLMLNGEDLWTLFKAKVAVCMVVLAAGITTQFLLVALLTITHENSLSLGGVVQFFVPLLVASGVMTIILMALAFHFKKPATSLCLGLAGSFLSLVTSGFLPKWLTIFIPWQYVAVLNPFTLQAVHGKGMLVYSANWLLYLGVMLVVGIVVAMGVKVKLAKGAVA